MKNTPIMIGMIAVLCAGAGFFGGMKYNQSKSTQFAQQVRNGSFGAGGPMGQQRQGARNGAGQILGTILSIDATSMTVKLPDGSSKIILVSGTTTFAKETTGALTDLKVGDRVGAFGTTNSDGSVTAVAIQINPQGRMGGNIQTPKPTQ